MGLHLADYRPKRDVTRRTRANVWAAHERRLRGGGTGGHLYPASPSRARSSGSDHLVRGDGRSPRGDHRAGRRLSLSTSRRAADYRVAVRQREGRRAKHRDLATVAARHRDVATGGYVYSIGDGRTHPGVTGGACRRVARPNAVPGLTTDCSPMVDEVWNAENTGVPVRASPVRFRRADAAARLGLDQSRKTQLVGGAKARAPSTAPSAWRSAAGRLAALLIAGR